MDKFGPRHMSNIFLLCTALRFKRWKSITSRCWVHTLIVFIFGAHAPLTFASSNSCPPEAPLQKPDALTGETCPDIGRMGSTRLAIPRHYISGPSFVYKGVDIWNADSYKNRPKKQSFNLEIRSFAIRIRLNNFKPVENLADREDYYRAQNSVMALPPKNNQWISAEFTYPSPFEENQKPVNMRFILERYVNNPLGVWPKMVRQKDVSGLEHYMAEKPLSTDTSEGEINEVFYDARSNRTLITCDNLLRHVAPHDPLSFCHHYFYTAKGDISIEIEGIRDKDYYLSRWKEIENGVLAAFNSFVVRWNTRIITEDKICPIL